MSTSYFQDVDDSFDAIEHLRKCRSADTEGEIMLHLEASGVLQIPSLNEAFTESSVKFIVHATTTKIYIYIFFVLADEFELDDV